MNSLELLDEALRLAAQLGVKVRQDWLAGAAGGHCEVRGQRYVFLDVSQSPMEQLERVLPALRRDPRLVHQNLSAELSRLLDVRRTA